MRQAGRKSSQCEPGSFVMRVGDVEERERIVTMREEGREKKPLPPRLPPVLIPRPTCSEYGVHELQVLLTAGSYQRKSTRDEGRFDAPEIGEREGGREGGRVAHGNDKKMGEDC